MASPGLTNRWATSAKPSQPTKAFPRDGLAAHWHSRRRRRAEDLERQDTKQFYDWFEKQNPGKTMAKEPGTPGEKPAFDLGTVNLPPASGENTGSVLDDILKLPSGSPQTESPAEEQPADGTAPPESAP